MGGALVSLWLMAVRHLGVSLSTMAWVLVCGCAASSPRPVQGPAVARKPAASRSPATSLAASSPATRPAGRSSSPCPELPPADPAVVWQSVTTVIDGVEFTVHAGVGAPGGQRRV